LVNFFRGPILVSFALNHSTTKYAKEILMLYVAKLFWFKHKQADSYLQGCLLVCFWTMQASQVVGVTDFRAHDS
jgi:hypothetical protein